MNDVTRYNNRLTVYLDQIFPSCDKAFSNIGGAASRAVLQECPTPPILLLKDENELARMICVAAYKHYAFGKKRPRSCAWPLQPQNGSPLCTRKRCSGCFCDCCFH